MGSHYVAWADLSLTNSCLSFSRAGVMDVCYHVQLSGLPNIHKYTTPSTQKSRENVCAHNYTKKPEDIYILLESNENSLTFRKQQKVTTTMTKA